MNLINISTVRNLREQISEEYRAFIIALLRAKHTLQEIADNLGLSRSTVDTLIQKGQERQHHHPKSFREVKGAY